jgi:AcrR family transcriptional regulator
MEIVMPRPKQITDEKLLNIALECFLEHGPNVSTQLIADKVGLSQPALFKRFGTKEELFLQAVAPPETFLVIEWLDSSPSPGPFKPQVVELLEKVLEMLIFILPRVQLLQDARIPRDTVMSRYATPPPIMLIMSIAGFFERAQQQGQLRRGVNPQFISQWIFGALMGQNFLSNTMSLNGSDRDITPFIESVVDLLCRGILIDETEK